jgi:putative transposase
MWTATDRDRHRRAADDYSSSLTDGEWAELEWLVPPAKRGGRPRATDMRAAADALFYLQRTGCPWRYLPRDGRFPTRSTVYSIVRGFQRDRVWEAIAATLVEAERQRQGREADPSAGILDSQTAPAAGKGGRGQTRWATTMASAPRAASDLWDCQGFRVLPVMREREEDPHGPTESSGDPGRDAGPTVVWRQRQHRL